MLSKLLSALPGLLTRRWLQFVFYGLAISMLSILLALCGAVTNDSWWHLLTGKELWEGNFSFIDNHSWTAPGAYWPAHELGFEWILYGLWRLAGNSFLPIALLNIVLVISALFLLIPPKRVRENFNITSNVLVPLILFGAGFTLLSSVQIRAQALSFLLFALTIRLILAKKPYWIPLVFLVWVYLHGSVFVGVAALGVATLVMIGRWLLERTDKEKLRDAIHFSIAGLLALVATCLSPLGMNFWVYFIDTLSFAKTEIQEWQPLVTEPRLFAYGITVAVLLVLSAWVLWKRRKSWELVFLYTLSVFFFLYSLSALRVYNNLLLSALPIIYLAAMTLVKSKLLSDEVKQKQKLLNISALSIIGLFTLFAFYFSVVISGQMMANGTRDPFKQNGVAEVLRSDQCKNSLWNDYDTGSYLLWFMPDIPVSFDSRFDLYPEWVKEAAGLVVPEGDSEDPTDKLNAVFKKYDIHCLVMTNTVDTDALKKRGLSVLAENQDMVVFEIPADGVPEKKSK